MLSPEVVFTLLVFKYSQFNELTNVALTKVVI